MAALSEPTFFDVVGRATAWAHALGPVPPKLRQPPPEIHRTTRGVLRYLTDWAPLTLAELAVDLRRRPDTLQDALTELETKGLARQAGITATGETLWAATERGHIAVEAWNIEHFARHEPRLGKRPELSRPRPLVSEPPDQDDYLHTIARWIPNAELPMESEPCEVWKPGNGTLQLVKVIPPPRPVQAHAENVSMPRTPRRMGRPPETDPRLPEVVRLYTKEHLTVLDVATIVHARQSKVVAMLRYAGVTVRGKCTRQPGGYVRR